MSFRDAVLAGMRGYADFGGRAGRSDYWYFMLFLALVQIGLVALFHRHPDALDALSAIVDLGFLVPVLAIGTRRLHDTGRSGWWQLIQIVPLVGAIVLLVFLCQRGTAAGDRFGSGARHPVTALA